MIKASQVLVASLAPGQLQQERTSEQDVGGGKIKVRKSADYMLQVNNRLTYGLPRSFGGGSHLYIA